MARDKQRRIFDNLKAFLTTVGAGSSFEGDIRGKDNCLVLGHGTGRCVVEGSVMIGHGARWTGTIEAENVLVAGHIEGDVTARNQLEVTATGRVNGTLRCPRVAMANGAIHSGEIIMSQGGTVTRFDERRSEPRGSPP